MLVGGRIKRGFLRKGVVDIVYGCLRKSEGSGVGVSGITGQNRVGESVRTGDGHHRVFGGKHRGRNSLRESVDTSGDDAH